ncbi:DUF481 domain-containing protein [Sphingomonas sp. Leaf21]|uniref:DUF481 domain-containing protein n=1 Tax=Sphingomonas sp. Leaf21 TaxID=2876550 RepID=UPI001E4380EE|nr:DUF481 domain-containing protein [Sphingomonas sp. Leaf21]
MTKRLLLIPIALGLLANADPNDPDPALIPPEIRRMLEAAIASGNETEITTVVKYARNAVPDAADAIDAMADVWRDEKTASHSRTIREATFFDLWHGRAELGGFATTGNSQNIGLTGIVDLTREGLQWRHKLHLQGDYQESFNIVSREHYVASYEPNFKLSANNYVYGAAQYESDRFLGYFNRFSASAGAGYSAIRKPNMTLDVELGPAFRHTEFTDDRIESALAARGNLNFTWKLTPAISFNQTASAYLQRFNSTVGTNSALNAKVFGPLSAQFSYNVQYESQPPIGRRTTDTISRASVVYSF